MHKIAVDEFKKYYSSLSPDKLEILDLVHREIAFLQFGENVMIRHTAFDNVKGLKGRLSVDPPAHLYYSSAYYTAPAEPVMSDKGWTGADLIFDIDADHIPTACKDEHDTWVCLECGNAGRGFPPEGCTKCGKKRIDTRTWVCEKCLGVAKNEIFKLIDDYLEPDFGITKDEIEICFSGHRGYHLHIVNSEIKKLSNDGRREIADYVRGIGLDQQLHGFRVIGKNERIEIGPNLKDRGWRGRLAQAIYDYLNKCDSDQLSKIMGRTMEKWGCRDKDDVLKKIAELSWWGGIKGSALEKLNLIAKESIKDIVCNIDERVTIDTKRLIRYPNSLHGKSGLITKRLSYTELEGFDPLSKAVAFRGDSIKIYVKDAPRIRIGDTSIGPLKDARVEVPKALGIYMICRGAAEPLN